MCQYLFMAACTQILAKMFPSGGLSFPCAHITIRGETQSALKINRRKLSSHASSGYHDNSFVLHLKKSFFTDWMASVGFLSHSNSGLSMNKSVAKVCLSLFGAISSSSFFLPNLFAQSKHCSSSSCLGGWKRRGEQSLPHLSVLHLD